MRNGAKIAIARALRKKMTEAEGVLWRHLRQEQLGVRFRRQHPRGPYVFDFACVERRLAVEVDGGQHNGSVHDERRDSWLAEQGWRVLRYWNHHVLGCTLDVVDDIHRTLAPERPHPSLPPQAGEGAKGKGRSPEGEEG